jgi:hypothetical protein
MSVIVNHDGCYGLLYTCNISIFNQAGTEAENGSYRSAVWYYSSYLAYWLGGDELHLQGSDRWRKQ